jgi:hypothetical protein
MGGIEHGVGRAGERVSAAARRGLHAMALTLCLLRLQGRTVSASVNTSELSGIYPVV